MSKDTREQPSHASFTGWRAPLLDTVADQTLLIHHNTTGLSELCGDNEQIKLFIAARSYILFVFIVSLNLKKKVPQASFPHLFNIISSPLISIVNFYFLDTVKVRQSRRICLSARNEFYIIHPHFHSFTCEADQLWKSDLMCSIIYIFPETFSLMNNFQYSKDIPMILRAMWWIDSHNIT